MAENNMSRFSCMCARTKKKCPEKNEDDIRSQRLKMHWKLMYGDALSRRWLRWNERKPLRETPLQRRGFTKIALHGVFVAKYSRPVTNKLNEITPVELTLTNETWKDKRILEMLANDTELYLGQTHSTYNGKYGSFFRRKRYKNNGIVSKGPIRPVNTTRRE